MKILFIGAVKSSRILLEKLIEIKGDIVGVVTGNSSVLNSDFEDLSIICKKNNIEYEITDNINDNKSINFIRHKEPDIIYCFGFSQLLCRDIIDIPQKGVVGFHPSKLPLNRGRHPLIWAIALGLRETASTFFFINEGIDEGDLISQVEVPIYYEDDATILYDRILEVACEQVAKFTYEIKRGNIVKIKQDIGLGNHWRKRSKKDGEIDWRMSSENIYNLVRALTKPYIGAHFTYMSREIKIWKVKEKVIEGIENLEPGKVVEVFKDGTFTVKTGKGCIQVLESESIQLSEGDYL